ncbi:MAG: hypothetical protein M1827_004787 [Pycnora praestabilis]|nr:MAG: hypothetical protein M1827_004787 [Pycnora praestabilis]
MPFTPPYDLPRLPLPTGITSSQLTSTEAGLSYHILSAGHSGHFSPPLILLLHGFPEIAYSWRKVMLPMAKAGYRVVAFDQRGYGRTTGWDDSEYSKVDLRTFSMTTLVRDVVILVHALGYKTVKCIVGHDFGAVAASLCALTRPDFFENVVLMSHPFKGSPSLPSNIAHSAPPPRANDREEEPDIHASLATLPEPRKHYKWYYSTPPAASEMLHPTSALQSFLRGYFHLKSGDWPGNDPHPLKEWSASELAKMPNYYIMPLHASMRDTVAKDMESAETVRLDNTHHWLPDNDLAVYAQEYKRTGFQGGLNWYRVQTDPANTKDMLMFAGAKITIPCLFISGTKDWGIYQEPGVVEKMKDVCTKFKGVRMIEGAGHWVQQERPESVVDEILRFLSFTAREERKKRSREQERREEKGEMVILEESVEIQDGRILFWDALERVG